jgi:hypothetical protein
LHKKKQADGHPDPGAAEAAVIAAGMFAMMGQAAAGPLERTAMDSPQNVMSAHSNWKAVARREALK